MLLLFIKVFIQMCLAIKVNIFVLLKIAPSKYLRIIIVSRTTKPELLRTNILFHFYLYYYFIIILLSCPPIVRTFAFAQTLS